MTETFQELVDKAMAAWNLLPDDEKRRQAKAQRRSWAIGEFMLEHPEVSREDAENFIDQIIDVMDGVGA